MKRRKPVVTAKAKRAAEHKRGEASRPCRRDPGMRSVKVHGGLAPLSDAGRAGAARPTAAESKLPQRVTHRRVPVRRQGINSEGSSIPGWHANATPDFNRWLRGCGTGLAVASVMGCSMVPSAPQAQASSRQFAPEPLLRIHGGALMTAQQAYTMGKAALQAGDLQRALLNFEKALSLSPAWADAENGKLVSLARLGRTDEAILSGQRAVAFGAHSAELHGNLGLLLDGRGESQRAAIHLARAAQLDPDNPTWSRWSGGRPEAAKLPPATASATAAVAQKRPTAVAVPAETAPAKPAAALVAASQGSTAKAPAAAAAADEVTSPATPPTSALVGAEVSTSAHAAPSPGPNVSPPVAPSAAPDAASVATAEAVPVNAAPASHGGPAASARMESSGSAIITIGTKGQALPAPAVPNEIASTSSLAVRLAGAAISGAEPLEALGTDASSSLRWIQQAPNVLMLTTSSALAQAQSPARTPEPQPLVTTNTTRTAASAPAVSPQTEIAAAPKAAPVPASKPPSPTRATSTDAIKALSPMVLTRVEISNGHGRRGLARDTATALQGVLAGTARITNHTNFRIQQTQVMYRSPEELPAALALARAVGVPQSLIVLNTALRATAPVRLLLGRDMPTGDTLQQNLAKAKEAQG